MDRRLASTALALLLAAPAFAQEATPRPRHKVSAEQLHASLSARFPVRVGVPGLLELQVTAPALLLLPARNRLGATLMVEAGGSQPHAVRQGEVDIVFALRYEASDRTLRAHRLEILEMRWPGLSAEDLRAIQVLAGRAARDAVAEVVLHRFTARDLALPETMGFQPDRITVLEDGALIEFGPQKPAARP